MSKSSWFGFAAFTVLAYGIYEAIFVAPTEATMGNLQRIFYIHVPQAWTAFLCLTANFVASVGYLLSRSSPMRARKWDALAFASAQVGVLFCTAFLITGILWAKPAWGIWWTWDARLTSAFVLYLIYISYLLLRRYSDSPSMATVSAALAIFGILDVPFVIISIQVFRTQHPAPVFAGGPESGLDPAMSRVFAWNMFAFTIYAAYLVFTRFRLKLLENRVEDVERAFETGTPLLDDGGAVQ
jgi:heme exporter protein C